MSSQDEHSRSSKKVRNNQSESNSVSEVEDSSVVDPANLGNNPN